MSARWLTVEAAIGNQGILTFVYSTGVVIGVAAIMPNELIGTPAPNSPAKIPQSFADKSFADRSFAEKALPEAGPKHLERDQEKRSGFDLIDFSAQPGAGRSLDELSLEDIVEAKIARFLDQMGSFFHENDNLHHMIMRRVEKPLLRQVMQRTGGNQVHASRILGINRNTLRKKIKIYDL